MNVMLVPFVAGKSYYNDKQTLESALDKIYERRRAIHGFVKNTLNILIVPDVRTSFDSS